MGKKVFIICLIIFFTVAPALGDEVLKITNGEWPPYLSKDLKYYGVASRIVTEAFAQEGVRVEYGFFPWKRALYLAEKGEWDGSAVWLRSPEREKLFYLSDPVIKSSYVFFHLKSFYFGWKKIDDLKGLRIGATIGYDYGEEFEKAEKDGVINVVRVPSDEQNLMKLLHGRIDIFPLDMEVGYTMLHKMYKPETVSMVTNSSKPLRADPLHLLLTRKNEKNAKLMELFNIGLKKLYEKGEIDRFLEEARQENIKIRQ